MKTVADHISGPLKTSDFSYREHYQLFDNLHVGITMRKIDRIMENISPSIQWGTRDNFAKKIEGKDEVQKYFETLLSTTKEYTAKIKLTCWDPLLEQGSVWIEYEHMGLAITGSRKQVHEFGIFQITDGLISDYLSMEKVMWERSNMLVKS